MRFMDKKAYTTPTIISPQGKMMGKMGKNGILDSPSSPMQPCIISLQ
jgi:hypothetical protein